MSDLIPPYFEFTDLMRVRRSVRLDRIESITHPGAGPNQHGGILTTNGQYYSFESDSTWHELKKVLAATREGK